MPALRKKHKKSSVHNLKSVMNTRYGKSTVHGYNAPCFENVVHYYVGSVLMRGDNEDRKDKSSL